MALAIGLAAAALWPAGAAQAWWNDEWSMRKKITLDTSPSGANVVEPVGTVPVLVRLHVGNFRFAVAKEDGADLRFVAGDDKTPLKHHVEKYDSLLGEALVWVQVPNVAPGAKSDLWLYYGNKKAVSVADAKTTYDPDSVLVYHFGERGTPAQDSSPWANHAQSAGQPADGAMIGTGLRLDGRTPLTLPGNPSLALADAAPFTWSTWVKMAAPQPNAVLYARRDGRNALVIGLDNGAPFVEVTRDGVTDRSATAAPIAPNAWRHIAVVSSGTQMSVVLDGQPYGVLAAATPALSAAATVGGDSARPVTPPPSSAPLEVSPSSGVDGAAAEGAGASTPPASSAEPGATPVDPVVAPVPVSVPVVMSTFAGDIDELQIAKVARPAGFVRVQAIGQGGDVGKLIGFAPDEETASWFTGYFAVILRSVTIDGWVVIALLGVMAVISWVVMIDKASYLARQAKANARFMAAFRELSADITAIDDGDPDDVSSLGGRFKPSDAKMLRNASLYRLYHVGVAELKHRFTDGQKRKLKGASLAAIRATLDATLVRESQRLSRLMVILTIAISGGPFLGLLGTVVGVMITFAAIAASGDVNINAIAPGIAAALVATVAGLVVAIPALFGYNYLITQIQNLNADMQVFVDEYVTKMGEAYRADGADHARAIAAE
ncbi:DUF2341 domain-containing protein [Rhodoplanes sp. TEM]|uniref:DUF2341 domain-containing protein n=2 Tax=Rhodoplanes TaxID=29407 RepID=A0ABT5JBG1_RHOTP|nr:MotA/TolQ/ExbB proton channel family protein [Rhodoplanes tepidamans]MDC7787020.1 DUF2341 domain-containing protein [Rhodoplanes tepidamans]MDC7986970.1 DUF2341 domain-containing protein [Rhodoplanes sp. TEM]MDQ0354255.1 biopolymer transport protein ExbB [Rhodoplanes tepidamans]